jgi:NAD(P) transhydrogenase subunit beta
LQASIATAASGLIGAVTLTGSVIAFLKLQGLMSGQAILLTMRHVINLLVFIATLGCASLVVQNPDSSFWFWPLFTLACGLGVLLVIPIGGADMPVVIALLNSLSGLAAAATGFVLQNNVLIIAGSLVGASGLILTQIMCKAMNRSLFNVIFGVLGEGGGGGGESQDDIYEGRVKSTSPEEVAMMLDGASYVIIVPGYGMAVSQAQHAVRDLTNLLESKGTKVEFAIHPVAGRMPGHMNVLLAEANIDYDKLREMDDINPSFAQCDVALVCGANDVVNPVARTDPSSPIAGMPILDVDKSRTVVVIKRSLSPGFAGIPNPLFAADNSLMLFSDGRKAFLDIISAVKEG